VFEKGPISDLKLLCTQVLKIPTIFKEMLGTRIKKTHPTAYQTDKLTKAGFLLYWKDTNQQSQDPKRRLFNLIAEPKSEFLKHEDFKPLFKHLLDTHPGLEFL
jgi:hypothetical protein